MGNKKVIVGCSGSRAIAKEVAQKLKLKHFNLIVEEFPDNELRIRFPKNVKGQDIWFFQSFYGDVNKKIIETLIAFYTAKDLGAKNISLMALYFPYLREDKRFESGEAINARIIAKFFSPFSKVFVINPHLHRLKNLQAFFPNAKELSTAKIIARYIKDRYQNYIIVGPDEESARWIAPISKILHSKYIILKKTRLTPSKVRIQQLKHHKKYQTAIIIDDIISTGGTMIEAIKQINPLSKSINCIAIHGIFDQNSLERLEKIAKVVSTNTIPSRASKIDIAETIIEALK